MEIGLFQLENLFTTPSRYRLFDIRLERKSLGPGLDRLIANAAHVKPSELVHQIQVDKLPLDFPIILLCETGQESNALAEKLESNGFTNVYVIEGGVEGLLSESR